MRSWAQVETFADAGTRRRHARGPSLPSNALRAKPNKYYQMSEILMRFAGDAWSTTPALKSTASNNTISWRKHESVWGAGCPRPSGHRGAPQRAVRVQLGAPGELCGADHHAGGTHVAEAWLPGVPPYQDGLKRGAQAWAPGRADIPPDGRAVVQVPPKEGECGMGSVGRCRVGTWPTRTLAYGAVQGPWREEVLPHLLPFLHDTNMQHTAAMLQQRNLALPLTLYDNAYGRDPARS